MSVSRIHDLVRAGRVTPEQAALLLELRRELRVPRWLRWLRRWLP